MNANIAKIRTAYNETIAYRKVTTTGYVSPWVGFAELREMAGLSRPDFDDAIRQLSLAGSGAMVEEETNQKTLTAAERAAAVNVGCRDQHTINFTESVDYVVERIDEIRADVAAETA